MSKENEKSLLEELRENLVYDLNFYDPSVGLFPVANLMDWAEDNIDALEGVELIKGEETSIVIKCDNQLFEIYEYLVQVGEEEYDHEWRIRPYEPSEDTINS